MASEEKFSNIFDAAAGRKKGGDLPKKHQNAHENISSSDSSESLEAQLARCKERSEEIKKKIENAYDEVKISPRDIEKYLETPQNFSDSQWKQIEKTKDEINSKLEILVKKRPPPEPPHDAEPAGETPQSSRPKTGFTSRKTWIPMR